MARVLIVSFSFAPSPDAGARRTVGLYKYLPASGWQPTILTASRERDADARVWPSDYVHSVASLKAMVGLAPDRGSEEQLRRRLPGWFVDVLRIPMRVVSEFAAYPDFENGWLNPALAVGRQLLAGGRFDAILSTSPPATSHLIGERLARASGLPWIADLRDLWSQGYAYPWSFLRRLVERRLEQRVLRSARALVSVSQPLADALGSLHPGKRTVAIVSGFDPEELTAGFERLTSRFTITYTGTIYPGKQDPTPVLEALRTTIQSGRIQPSDVRLRFYCRPPTESLLHQLCRSPELDEVVEIHGVCSREEAIGSQRESQLLLLLDWNDTRQPGVYTAKFFEYLAARRPILAFGPGASVIESALAATGAGSYATSQAGLEELLLAYYAEYAQTGRIQGRGDTAALEPYSQRRMAHEFGRLLDSVTSPQS